MSEENQANQANQASDPMTPEKMFLDFMEAVYNGLDEKSVQYNEIKRAFYSGMILQISFFADLSKLPIQNDEINSILKSHKEEILGVINRIMQKDKIDHASEEKLNGEGRRSRKIYSN